MLFDNNGKAIIIDAGEDRLSDGTDKSAFGTANTVFRPQCVRRKEPPSGDMLADFCRVPSHPEGSLSIPSSPLVGIAHNDFAEKRTFREECAVGTGQRRRLLIQWTRDAPGEPVSAELRVNGIGGGVQGLSQAKPLDALPFSEEQGVTMASWVVWVECPTTEVTEVDGWAHFGEHLAIIPTQTYKRGEGTCGE